MLLLKQLADQKSSFTYRQCRT